MRMKMLTSLLIMMAACGCSQKDAAPASFSEAQAKSRMGPVSAWKIDPALPRAELQNMRDRAYRYCVSAKAGDRQCFVEQDLSLFEFARSFAIARFLISEDSPANFYAEGLRSDPKAFRRAVAYCYSIYSDHGAADARMLGPCVSPAVGGNFFGIATVD